LLLLGVEGVYDQNYRDPHDQLHRRDDLAVRAVDRARGTLAAEIPADTCRPSDILAAQEHATIGSMRGIALCAMVAVGCSGLTVSTRPAADVARSQRVVSITGYTTTKAVHQTCVGSARGTQASDGTPNLQIICRGERERRILGMDQVASFEVLDDGSYRRAEVAGTGGGAGAGIVIGMVVVLAGVLFVAGLTACTSDPAC
jgi:hypothetical protein